MDGCSLGASLQRTEDTSNLSQIPQVDQSLPNDQDNPSPSHSQGNPPQNAQKMDCEHCFQTPCVTSHYHQWLGNGQAPCVENSVIRKEKYTKYWKVINNLGGWNDPRYLAKKISAEEGEWAITHRREIMPVCVLTNVRNLYPNPKGQPYMGHKWE